MACHRGSASWGWRARSWLTPPYPLPSSECQVIPESLTVRKFATVHTLPVAPSASRLVRSTPWWSCKDPSTNLNRGYFKMRIIKKINPIFITRNLVQFLHSTTINFLSSSFWWDYSRSSFPFSLHYFIILHLQDGHSNKVKININANTMNHSTVVLLKPKQHWCGHKDHILSPTW